MTIANIRPPILCFAVATCTAMATMITARAQLAPLPQKYAVAIGLSQLRAPATEAFCPQGTFTMEGWFYLEEATPSGWLMGKNHSVRGADPYTSFVLYLCCHNDYGFEFFLLVLFVMI